MWYPNLSEGADRVGGQLRGDKESPFTEWHNQICVRVSVLAAVMPSVLQSMMFHVGVEYLKNSSVPYD